MVSAIQGMQGKEAILKLSEHFTLEEMTASDYATRHGLDNSPDQYVLENLIRLANHLEDVRMVLGSPIYISSGYRSALVNKGVGGSKNSDHIKGLAADFVCHGFGTPKAICQELILAGIQFKQLIHEGRWVHYSIPEIGKPYLKEILTASFKGGKATYTRGIS